MQVECNGLLKECSALRSEKQDVVNKHQKEKSGLQSECASLRAEKEDLLKTQQREKAGLQDECTKLRSEKEAALLKQQQFEKDLARSVVGVLLRARPALPPVCSLWLTVHQLFPVSLIHYFLKLFWAIFVFLFLIVCVPRMLSWAAAWKPSRAPRRSWRSGWQPCSSSTSKKTPSYRPNLMKLTVTAKPWRERSFFRLRTLFTCLPLAGAGTHGPGLERQTLGKHLRTAYQNIQPGLTFHSEQQTACNLLFH